MTQINSAKVHFNIQMGGDLTWNVKPLLHEVKHALKNLIEHGEASVIDLRSIPLAPGEEDAILNTLGRGEVQCLLDALGSSEIIETQYAGVWLITHFNDEHDITSRFIEITFMPEILRSQSDDVIESFDRLTEKLRDKYEATKSVVEESE